MSNRDGPIAPIIGSPRYDVPTAFLASGGDEASLACGDHAISRTVADHAISRLVASRPRARAL